MKKTSNEWSQPVALKKKKYEKERARRRKEEIILRFSVSLFPPVRLFVSQKMKKIALLGISFIQVPIIHIASHNIR